MTTPAREPNSGLLFWTSLDLLLWGIPGRMGVAFTTPVFASTFTPSSSTVVAHKEAAAVEPTVQQAD